GWFFRDDLARARESQNLYVEEHNHLKRLGPAWEKFRALDLPLEKYPYFVWMRVADFWKGMDHPNPSALAQKQKAELERDIKRHIGLPPGQIDLLVLFARDNPLGDSPREIPLALVQTKMPYAKEKFDPDWQDV